MQKHDAKLNPFNWSSRVGSMRRIIRTLLVGLCMAWLPAMSGAAETKRPEPLPIETMRAAVYTKAFAKRFALPDPEPGTEPTGVIQGMEFHIRPHRVMARYSCDLILYLDNTLPIAWPEDARASVSGIPTQDTLLMSNVPRERFLKLSVEDRRHSFKRETLWNMRARIVTPDFEYPKRGGAFDVTYREYNREFFPGMAFVKLDIGCSFTGRQLEKFLAHSPSIELWLLKTGGRNYTDIGVEGVDRSDFVRLALPRTFLERVLPWINAGEDYNMAVFEDEARRERLQRMKEAEQQMKEWDKELAGPEARRQLGETLKRKH